MQCHVFVIKHANKVLWVVNIQTNDTGASNLMKRITEKRVLKRRKSCKVLLKCNKNLI